MLIPPPYAIDIGDRTVKIAQLIPRHRWDPQRAWPCLRDLAEHDLTEGWVVNGEIMDPSSLATFLRRVIARATPWFLRSTHAVITLPETRTYLTTIAVPSGDDHAATVRRTVAAALPIDAEHAVIATTTISGTDERIAIAAVPTDVVESYATLLRRVGLTLIACTTEADALARAVASTSPTPTPKIVLDFGATRTGAIIAAGTVVAASVTIPVSGMQLTAAIAAKLRIDLAAAERTKHAADLTRVASDDRAATALADALAPLIDGITRLRAFASTHLPMSMHPTSLTLTGGGAALGGLDQFLREHIRLPVDRFILPDAVTTELPPHATAHSGRLATLFGLGLIALDPVATLSEPTL
ncbi:MAG: pilus assembly protein PilM [bacterium]|nr:pilus assembly protein PilM [bacterium]